MSSQLKNSSNYTNEDLVIWAAAQVEAMKQPGRGIPSWMTGVFQEAMEREKEIKAAAAAVKVEDGANKVDVQDDIFKFEMVYFKVENTIFTVIKDWFMVEDSPFQAMFTLPPSGSSPAAVEGTMITNPIMLEQTSAASFKAFLCLLYGPRGKLLETYDEWVRALELAMRWNFDQVRTQAIAGVSSLFPSLSPVSQIQLGRRFSVGPWLRRGLINLVAEVVQKSLTPNFLISGLETEAPLDAMTVANIFFACYAPSEIQLEDRVCISCVRALGAQGFIRAGCQDCMEVERAKVVDRIFGAEIKGCMHVKGGEFVSTEMQTDEKELQQALLL